MGGNVCASYGAIIDQTSPRRRVRIPTLGFSVAEERQDVRCILAGAYEGGLRPRCHTSGVVSGIAMGVRSATRLGDTHQR